MSTERLDVVARMLSRLATMYRGKPNMEGLLSVIGKEIQEAEDAVQGLLTLRDVDAAVGAQLSGLERLVGQNQFVFTDDVIRRAWIKARILLNRSSGRGDELLGIFAAVLDPSLTPELTERFPAALDLRVAGGAITADLAASLAKMLQIAKAGGVRATLLWQSDADAQTFRFADPLFATATIKAFTANGSSTLPVFRVYGPWPGFNGLSFDEFDVAYPDGGSGDHITDFDGLTFTVDGGTTSDHNAGAHVTLVGGAAQDAGKGFDDASAPGTGGKLAGAI